MIRVELQRACDSEVPDRQSFQTWADMLAKRPEPGNRVDKELAVTIRVVAPEESAALNLRYRKKSGPTNVLSFSYPPPAGLAAAAPELLTSTGDLVMCAALINKEAAEQGKPLAHHWCHLTLHGLLHLLGYDHQTAAERQTLETLERAILTEMDIPDPYLETNLQQNGPSEP